MVFRLLAVFAEFERNLISERVLSAAAYKRSRGEKLGRFAAYGFDLAPDGVMLVPTTRSRRTSPAWPGCV